MGYERKRGKLAALNGVLRGKGRENFSLIVADESFFSEIKYVITLDSDTQLPRDAAWKMIGTIAHPLNTALGHAAFANPATMARRPGNRRVPGEA